MINDQGNIVPVDAAFLIGANPQTGASNREWNGFIDEGAQWDRVLDASEISSILSLGEMVVHGPSSTLFGIFGSLALLRRCR